MTTISSNTPANPITAGQRTLEVEIAGMEMLKASIGTDFAAAVELLVNAKGRVILAGVGKSGHVARKIAATLASTGTPAQFVHPTEASHGDLGMITPGDVVVGLSKSGDTKELGDLIAYAKRFSIPLIAMTCQRDSLLGRDADIVLEVPDAPEACAETRAPTTSTTLMMALGDALAVALLEMRGFDAANFRTFHPGGALGGALARVEDLMHSGDQLPVAAPDTSMADVLIVMSEKRFGCVGVIENGRLAGIVTDGDLRRHMGDGLVRKPAREVMTVQPKVVTPDIPAAEALRIMTAEEPRVTVLFVVDAVGAPVGVLHMHDCLRAGVA